MNRSLACISLVSSVLAVFSYSTAAQSPTAREKGKIRDKATVKTMLREIEETRKMDLPNMK